MDSGRVGSWMQHASRQSKPRTTLALSLQGADANAVKTRPCRRMHPGPAMNVALHRSEMPHSNVVMSALTLQIECRIHEIWSHLDPDAFTDSFDFLCSAGCFVAFTVGSKRSMVAFTIVSLIRRLFRRMILSAVKLHVQHGKIFGAGWWHVRGSFEERHFAQGSHRQSACTLLSSAHHPPPPSLFTCFAQHPGWKPTTGTQCTGTHNVALHLKAASRETKGPKHVPSWIRTRLARLRLPSRKRQAQHRFARCSAHGSATCSPSLILHSPLQPRLVQDTVAAAPAADRIVAPKVGRRPAAAAPGKRTRVGSVTRRNSLGVEEGGEGG